jgi:hypothetical protein
MAYVACAVVGTLAAGFSGRDSLPGVDAADGQPPVIIFTGLPGTGNSTLAEQVARIVRAPAFAGDWLMGGQCRLRL